MGWIKIFDMEEDAKTIADILSKTKTENRGLLLMNVSIELGKKTQYFTAKIILDAANKYGI
jgi:hypothetical protein